MEPITPIIITGHTGRSNIICNKIMMVNAGGRKRSNIHQYRSQENQDILPPHNFFYAVISGKKRLKKMISISP
jgi:hypothetical protein